MIFKSKNKLLNNSFLLRLRRMETNPINIAVRVAAKVKTADIKASISLGIKLKQKKFKIPNKNPVK